MKEDIKNNDIKKKSDLIREINLEGVQKLYQEADRDLISVWEDVENFELNSVRLRQEQKQVHLERTFIFD